MAAQLRRVELAADSAVEQRRAVGSTVAAADMLAVEGSTVGADGANF
jgi:hypothetical protein